MNAATVRRRGTALALAAAAGWGLLQWTRPADRVVPAAAPAVAPQAAALQQALPAVPAASAPALLPAAPYPTVAASSRDPHEAFQQALQRVQAQPVPPPPPAIAQARSLPEAFAAMQAAQREQQQASGAALNPFATLGK